MAEWWKDTTIYQIYPRSFCDSDGDGVGDLKGIISKVDYLADLGVETIWFSPFYCSPQTDHGYDISDYVNVNPEYGTMEDAEELIRLLHERGLKVVFDMVMNHTSDKHQWFLDSAERKNGKDDWYIWRDAKPGCFGKSTPNNWRSMVGPNGWNWHEGRQQYYFSSFLSFQPDLNYRNPEVKKAMLEVVKFWMDKGVDGFRLDIFNAIYKDASFEDNPFSFRPAPSHECEDGFFQKKIYTVNHKDTYKFAKELRAYMDTASSIKKERFLIGEVIGDPTVLRNYMGNPSSPGLNLTFMFELLDFEFTSSYFAHVIEKFEKEFAPPYKPALVFTNHDIRRTMYRVDGSLAKAKVVAMLQCTMRGVPCMYYGDEIGMTEGSIPLSEGQDPVAKLFSRYVPQFVYDSFLLKNVSMNRDNCRTPMQWQADSKEWKNSWLPVNPDTKTCNVKTQTADSDSILNLYKRLLKFRRETPALYRGTIEIYDLNQSNLLCFKRYDAETKTEVIVCIYFGKKLISLDSSLLSNDADAKVSFNSIALPGKELEMVISTDSRNAMDEQGMVHIYGASGVVFK